MKEVLSLLLADDEAIIRRKVCMMLGNRFRIDQVATAEAARVASAQEYDAILLDIVFPDGNGIDLCREIKHRDLHRTVVISSSMESVDAWDQAFRAGADGYLEKRELMGLDPRKISLMIENLVERNRLRRKTEEVTKQQAELLSVLSHDVRAPFQTLLGTIDLLRKVPIPSDAAESVETLYHCARDQLAFINSLLELLRLESGMIGLRPMSVDINLPVQQSLHGLQILAAKKSISLEPRLADPLPTIRGDLGRLCQLVNNLVSNAIKFTPRHGSIVVATACLTHNGIPGVELSVTDSGIGINPEERDKIFQRFHRGRCPGTEGERGTGLGLTICREIVALHEGILDLEPVLPNGSRFTVWFAGESSHREVEQQPGCNELQPSGAKCKVVDFGKTPPRPSPSTRRKKASPH